MRCVISSNVPPRETLTSWPLLNTTALWVLLLDYVLASVICLSVGRHWRVASLLSQTLTHAWCLFLPNTCPCFWTCSTRGFLLTNAAASRHSPHPSLGHKKETLLKVHPSIATWIWVLSSITAQQCAHSRNPPPSTLPLSFRELLPDLWQIQHSSFVYSKSQLPEDLASLHLQAS